MPCMQVMRSEWYQKRGFSDVYYDQSLLSEDTLRINKLHKDMPGQLHAANCSVLQWCF